MDQLIRPIGIVKNGTSAYSDFPSQHESVSCKGLKIFLNFTGTGNGSVTSTLKYQDNGVPTDYSVGSITATSAAPLQMMTVYPGVVPGTSALFGFPTYFYNDVVPSLWHVDSITTGTALYNLIAFPIP